jgi:hypothetical protein
VNVAAKERELKARFCHQDFKSLVQRFPNRGTPTTGGGGSSFWCGIFVLNDIRAHDRIYILLCLVEIFYLSPGTASELNHILSPVKVSLLSLLQDAD